MTPERWDRIQTVFLLALDCEPTRRAACLDEACSGDVSLRDEVNSLLCSEPDAHQFLDAAVNRAVDSYRLAAATAAGRIDFHGTDRFAVQDRVGSGGFGSVYRVYDRERNVSVALKTLHHLGAAQLLALKREFRALADISHPNLVVLYELIWEGDQCFFTMELVEGVNFREYVRNSKRLLEVLKQLALGVSALHSAGKLHRDLKPSNVLVNNNDRVVILDFGLTIDSVQHSPTDSEPIAGTPAYMSPEQRTGQPLSEASDWYSVGVMLHEALTGRLPDTGVELRPPTQLALGIPKDLSDLCIELLHREPEMRPPGHAVCKRLGITSRDAPPSSSQKVPFVGRESQLEVLADAFASTKVGRATGIYIHGSSGSGKTALAQCFLERLRRRETVLVLAGRCYERESVPYKAIDNLVDALSVYLKNLPDSELDDLAPDVSILSQLFPVLRGLTRKDPGERSLADVHELRRQGFAAFRDLLKRLVKRTPVVLFIDDLQWGDSDSATLVAELLRSPNAPAVLLLGCYRTEEAGTSPFLHTLSSQSATAGPHSLRLPLQDLSPPEAMELAGRLLGTEEPTSQAVGIAGHSRGNPFFITELARHAKSRDKVRAAVPNEPSLNELVRVRVSLLPDSARRFLEVVAVAGQPIDCTVAKRALEHTEDERATLAVLRVGHLIRTRTTTNGQEVEAYHDRIRETLIASMPDPLMRELHLRLGRTIESSSRAEPDVLAMHFAAAGCRPEALRYALEAADKAAAALAFDSAARFCRTGLELQPTEPDLVLALQRKLGEALSGAGRGAQAAEAYLAAADVARSSEALELRRQAASQYLISGHVDRGRDVIKMLLQAIGMKLAGSPRRALVSMLIRRIRINLRGLHYREREPAAVAQADLIRVDTCFSVAQGLGFIDTIHAADFQSRHILLALRTGEKYRVARALCVEAGYHGLAGTRRTKRTKQTLDAAMKLSGTCDNPHALGLSTVITGTCAFLQGRWKEGKQAFSCAETLLLERCAGSVWELATARLQGSACSFFLGEWNELHRRLPALVADAGARGDLYLSTALRTRLGHVSPLAGDRPEEALNEIRSGIVNWSAQGFHTQHWWSLISQCDILLYQHRGTEAWALIQRNWPGLEKFHAATHPILLD